MYISIYAYREDLFVFPASAVFSTECMECCIKVNKQDDFQYQNFDTQFSAFGATTFLQLLLLNALPCNQSWSTITCISSRITLGKNGKTRRWNPWI